MWIIPDTYLPASVSAQDMVESKEDLNLPGLDIESSLMWRSKPSQLRTWLQRWNRVSWMRPLFIRILKPSRQAFFEEQLTLSLADIRASRLAQQANVKGQKTPDTCGPTSQRLSGSYDPVAFSLRMSKATSASDLTKSSATWKNEVTIRRGEYSQRLKLARITRENESTSWATPNTMDHLAQRSEEGLRRQATGARKGRTRPANLREQVSPEAVAVYAENRQWLTPRATDIGKGESNETFTKRMGDRSDRVAQSLPAQVNNPKTWPTVRVSSGNGASQKELAAGNPKRRLETEVLLNPNTWPTPSAHEARLGYQDRSDPSKKGSQKSLLTVIVDDGGGRDAIKGHLNPDWVESLMGVPQGWTSLTGGTGYMPEWTGDWERAPRVVDACVDRVDRIRMLGNGVVPQTAAKAWEILDKELTV